MPQIINESPGLGLLFGQGVGAGIHSSIENVAKQKAAKLEKDSLKEAYKRAGIPDELAEALPNFSPQERIAILQRIQPGDFQQQSQQQGQQQPDINQLMSLIMGGQEQQQQPSFQQSLQQLGQKGPALSGNQALQQAIAEYQQQQQASQQNNQQFGQQQQQIQPQQQQETPQQQQQRPANITDILSRPSPGEQRLENRSQRDYEQRQQHHNDSRYGKHIQDIYARSRAKHAEDAILKRTIATRESGKVRNAHLSQALKVIGIDYEALKNKETLEVQKLQNYFLRGGKEIFGGRLTNFDAAKILESVPSLLQTDEGAKWLANQMLNLNKQDHEEARITNEILKQNKGNTPDDFDQQLYERMEPFYEKWTDDFVNGAEAFTTRGKIGSVVPKLPSAREFANKTYRNTDTGKIYVSNGISWKLESPQEREARERRAAQRKGK